MAPATSADPAAFDRRRLPPGFAFGAWTAADGWTHRRFEWAPAGRPRGSLLFQSGRADFAEKYLEALAHWHDRGWHVAGFDWRGQGGSGRLTPRAARRQTLDPLVEDLAGFVAEWTAATPGPHVLVGHSMGGHLILRYLAERGAPGIAAAVLVAPMLGLVTAPLPPWLARRVIAAGALLGRLGRVPWRRGDPPGRQARLTGSVERYADELHWRATQPELVTEGLSWRWLAAALASIERLEAPGALERVGVPILLLAARDDRLVSTAAADRAARRLGANLYVFDDAAHELLRERDPVREAALAAIDRFLAAEATRR